MRIFPNDLTKSFTPGSQFLAIFWISDFTLFVIVMPLTFPSSVTPINTLPPEEFANETKSLPTPQRPSLNSVKYPSPSCNINANSFLFLISLRSPGSLR